MSVSDNDFVYARVSFRGFIPELNRNGPIKGGFISKEQFKELVRNDYDVMLLNRAACPEFYDQMVEYRAAVREAERAKHKRIIQSPFDDAPNSVVKSVLKATENLTTQINPVGASDLVQHVLDHTPNLNPNGNIPVSGEYASQIGIFDQIQDQAVPVITPEQQSPIFDPSVPEGIVDQNFESSEDVAPQENMLDAINDMLDSELPAPDAPTYPTQETEINQTEETVDPAPEYNASSAEQESSSTDEVPDDLAAAVTPAKPANNGKHNGKKNRK